MGLVVADDLVLEAEWDGYGSNAPTAATVQVYTWDGSTRQYLQAGEATLGPSAHDFACTSLGSGTFRKSLVVDGILDGLRVEWEFTATGPLASYPKCGSDDGLRVTTTEGEDGLEANLEP